MAELIKPVFFETDPNVILAEMTAYYEGIVLKKLQPGQPETLLINAFVYREVLLRQKANAACLQSLVQFASAPALDYLGQLVGTNRLAAQGAVTTLEYTFVAGQGGVTVPAGNRVASKDGNFIFTTLEDLSVSANIAVVTATVAAECSTLGTGGNDYAPGNVSIMLDPLAFVSSVANTTLTARGADDETDDALRARILLASDGFSTAGPKGAYIYWAKTASAQIIDVAVTSLHPGEVDVYPLVGGGITTPTEILDAVFAILDDDKIRPLTDTVIVTAPTKTTYTMTANLTLYSYADQPATVAAVTDALTAFANDKATKLGKDVVVTQAKGVCVKIDGVYDVAFPDLTTDIIMSALEYAYCTAITVNVIGTVND